eukprot:TRINITY_DN859_c4_g1_i1.p1 TRINITY_DN859_c4_g1~~TRINITY_DN859_c4_g1_i1.p1  ORF type:complete len:429 (+),score=106.20 TRINITY_DN859_c4_g1_i1:96-1382(+)
MTEDENNKNKRNVSLMKGMDPIEKGEEEEEERFVDENFGFTSLEVELKENDEMIDIPLPSWVKEKKNIIQESVAIDELESILNPLIFKNIQQNLGFKEFFPVQRQLIPLLVQSRPFGGDVCICAPTGSGKTITYVIPIIQSLINRVVIRLRALVIVPTQNLVNQVTEVFESVSQGTDLKIGSLGGDEESFINQQKQIVRPVSFKENQSNRCEGYSKVDILVSTPSSLVQHLDKTSQFTLEHLQFLIVDEADRMLTKVASQNNWVHRMVQSSHLPSSQIQTGINILDMKVATSRSSMRPRFDPRDEPLFKLLFSATLSGNLPALSNLHLVNPQFYTTALDPTHFRLPTRLEQYTLECEARDKPLVLLHLLLNIKLDKVLCFLPGSLSAHRLYLLLNQYLGDQVAEFSDKIGSIQRKEVLHNFADGSIKM